MSIQITVFLKKNYVFSQAIHIWRAVTYLLVEIPPAVKADTRLFRIRIRFCAGFYTPSGSTSSSRR